jgi:hypothetical protein
MFISLKVDKKGKPQDYINLPLTNRVDEFGYNPLNEKVKAIGVVMEVKEVDDKYELTIQVWDKYLSPIIEFSDNVPCSMSISI